MLDTRSSGHALRAKRVLITRPREQGSRMADACRSLGAEAIVAPAIAIVEPTSWAPLDAALVRLESYAWLVVTSVHAARAVRDRLLAMGAAPRVPTLRLAAVGPATAAALAGTELGDVLVSPEHMAQSLADQLPDVAGSRILFPRGDRAREILPERLRARGAIVDDPVAYRTIPGDGLAVVVSEVAAERCDALVLTSPSAVQFVVSALAERGMSLAVRAGRARPALFCLGPVTAEAARKHGVEPHGVAAANPEDLIQIMAQWFADAGAG